MLDKVIIVFSGFNQRAVIAFLRTLEMHKLSYAIIAKSNADTIFLTDYKEKVYSIRSSVPLDFEDLIKSINIVRRKKKCDEFIIAPSKTCSNFKITSLSLVLLIYNIDLPKKSSRSLRYSTSSPVLTSRNNFCLDFLLHKYKHQCLNLR